MAKMREFKGNSLVAFPDDYVVIDIETTGLDPAFDGIIEIGAIKVRNGKITKQFESLVRPDYYFFETNDSNTDYITIDGEKCCFVDAFITQLTGITNQMLADAPSTKDVLLEFVKFLGDDIIVGHNVNFDINFIYDNLQKHYGQPLCNDYVDTMRLSRRIHKNFEHHRLADVAEYYRIHVDKSHRAIADCEITNACLIKMKDTVISRFGDVSQFYNYTKPKHHHLKACEITASVTDFNAEHPLYGKVCVFTGVLKQLSRKDAMQIVVNCGGICADNVTHKTNFLILGNNDYNPLVKNGKSSKQKKAEKLIIQGCDLKIISENVFYDIIGGNW